MLSSIKIYIYGALAAIGAGLVIALKVIAGQRDRQRDRADAAERGKAAAVRQRDREQAAAGAQASARKEAKEMADAEADRVAAGDRPDQWGDGRLRKTD